MTKGQSSQNTWVNTDMAWPGQELSLRKRRRVPGEVSCVIQRCYKLRGILSHDLLNILQYTILFLSHSEHDSNPRLESFTMPSNMKESVGLFFVRRNRKRAWRRRLIQSFLARVQPDLEVVISRFSLAKFAGDTNSVGAFGVKDSAAANGEHPDESAASRLLESYSGNLHIPLEPTWAHLSPLGIYGSCWAQPCRKMHVGRKDSGSWLRRLRRRVKTKFACSWVQNVVVLTSSTAQGGGGSFNNRKPVGELGCCESRMAERIHWWTERWLELCFLEWLQWLQWSPQSQLLDVVWCSAVVVVVVVVVVGLMLLKL